MAPLDWAALGGYFLVMLLIGLWSHKRVGDVSDYFTGGGRMPWWLSGISHHMSGYSAAVFVAYAAIAYSYGITVYVWAFLPLALGTGVGAWLFAPRWNRLRQRYAVASPLEYLAKRYNVPTQQALAWSGALLKVFDVAAKWASVAVLLNVFTGMSMTVGILITGVVTLLYCTVGGLWADALTDFGQFIIQGFAALAMVWVVLDRLGDGISGLGTIWHRLPEGHGHPLVGPYTATFLGAYVVVKLFEYNGGMWNLAQRYMATDTPKAARRSAGLSAVLYVVWPAVLLFPPLAAAVLLPDITDPQKVYALMAQSYLAGGPGGADPGGDVLPHDGHGILRRQRGLRRRHPRHHPGARARRQEPAPGDGAAHRPGLHGRLHHHQHGRRHRSRSLRRGAGHHRRPGRRRDGADLHSDAARTAAPVLPVRPTGGAVLLGARAARLRPGEVRPRQLRPDPGHRHPAGDLAGGVRRRRAGRPRTRRDGRRDHRRGLGPRRRRRSQAVVAQPQPVVPGSTG